MIDQDLDPNFFLPLWQALVSHFSRYRPLVLADQYTTRNEPEASFNASREAPLAPPRPVKPANQVLKLV